MKLHLFAHNNKNYVKNGDKVTAYGDWIGEIGKGNKWYAHLHYSVSIGLTPVQLRSYVSNWSKVKVEEHYIRPNPDRDKMFEYPVDDGQAGYDYLQPMTGGGFHPAVDYNGYGGGDSDLGYKFKCPVDGVVIASEDWGGGWGNIIIVEEISNNENNMEEKHEKNFRRIADAVSKKTGVDYGENPNNSETDEMLEKLSKIESSDCLAQDQKIKSQKTEINNLTEKLTKKTQELNDTKEALEKSSFAYKLLKDIQRVFLSIINFK